MSTVAIFGASGQVGQKITKRLIGVGHEIICYGRTEKPSKFGEKQQAIDFDKLSQYTFDGDAVIVAIGTTQAKAGSAEAFIKVDYELVKNIGIWSKQQGIKEFHVVSSVGAAEQARGLYLQTKWRMEQSITALGFEKLCIYRPSLYADLDRQPIRIKEVGSIPLLNVYSLLTAKNLNFRPINTDILVEKIKQSVERDDLPQVSIFKGNDIYKAVATSFVPYRKKEQTKLVQGIGAVVVAWGLIELLGYGGLPVRMVAAGIVAALSFLWIKSYWTLKNGALSDDEEYVKNQKTQNFLRILVWIELIAIVASLVLSNIPIAILVFILFIFDVQFFYNVQDYLNGLKQ
ncbi:MAG: NAD-dependent epimerase/dehydratase family protein [Bacteroidota bacterium]